MIQRIQRRAILAFLLRIRRLYRPDWRVWLIRFRRHSKWDEPMWQTGPFLTYSLRLPIFGFTLRIERTLARWQ